MCNIDIDCGEFNFDSWMENEIFVKDIDSGLDLFEEKISEPDDDDYSGSSK